MTIARVLPRTTAALDPGAIVASTAEATLRSLWAAPETKTAARGLVVAACAVAAAFPRPFATAAAVLAATAAVLHASNALARPSSLRRGALLLSPPRRSPRPGRSRPEAGPCGPTAPLS